jgi:hypothetical protein
MQESPVHCIHWNINIGSVSYMSAGYTTSFARHSSVKTWPMWSCLKGGIDVFRPRVGGVRSGGGIRTSNICTSFHDDNHTNLKGNYQGVVAGCRSFWYAVVPANSVKISSRRSKFANRYSRMHRIGFCGVIDEIGLAI